MFPFTEHIETLGIFVREEVGDGKPPESIDTWRKDNVTFRKQQPQSCWSSVIVEKAFCPIEICRRLGSRTTPL